MVIDFHTHLFPEKIAAKAISVLADTSGVTPSTDGTAPSLLASMEQAGVDLSVVLPVITDPHQFESILRFAVRINEQYGSTSGPRLLSFAGIHPDCADIREKCAEISREGFRGIKLHPDYQGGCFDDIRYLRILDAASEQGLCIVVHAGFDPISPKRQHCSPDMILHAIKETAPSRLVLAHMGSNKNYQESLEKLCGQDVYLDTSFCLTDMPEEMFIRMVRAHGADRILFATDCPWGQQDRFLQLLRSMDALSAEEKEQILWQNASRLIHVF